MNKLIKIFANLANRPKKVYPILFSIIFLLTINFPANIWAKEVYSRGPFKVDLSGFFINLLTVSQFKSFSVKLGQDRFEIDDLSRFRLKLKASLGDDLQFHCHVETRALVKTNGNRDVFGNFEPGLHGGLFAFGVDNRFLDMDDDISTGGNHLIQIDVERLYLLYSVSIVTASVGRQSLTLGSGLIWNPLDLFNPFSPTEIATEEKKGFDSAIVNFQLGPLSEAGFIYGLWDELEDMILAGYYKLNVKGVDFTVLSGKFRGNDIVIGADVIGSIKGAGVHAGITGTVVEDGENFVRAVVGADYQFRNTLYILVEYYFNGFGASSTLGYMSRFEDPRFQRAEVFNVGRHYIGTHMSYELTPLLKLKTGIIFNCQDPSVIINPILTWDFRKNWVFEAGVLASFGEGPLILPSGLLADGSEYGLYPNVYYAQIKYFF